MADVAAWYLALGAVALVALRRESWRIPVIALAFVQYALHSLNHLIDVGEADPGLARSANLVSLALTTILLGAMRATVAPVERGAPACTKSSTTLELARGSGTRRAEPGPSWTAQAPRVGRPSPRRPARFPGPQASST
jgi:hypothetical protein